MFSPGRFVHEYLAGKRVGHVNPVRLFFYAFFVEVTVKIVVANLMPGNPLVEQGPSGITFELINFALTIVWGLIWSVLYHKEDLNLVEYVVAAIFFISQTFILSAITLLVLLPFANSFQSPSVVHSAVDLAVYFTYSCIFAYALFNVRWYILIIKQALVAAMFLIFLWGLIELGILSFFGIG